MSENILTDHYLDLRGHVCPVNFVKCCLVLENLSSNHILKVDLDVGESEISVIDGIKQPYYFFSNSKPLLYSAGLYWNRSSGDIETSIITREAVGELQTVHNRSPLLLNDRLKDLWISDITGEEIYSEILEYTYSDIEFYRVDRAVNNPKNNNESLIKKYEDVPF